MGKAVTPEQERFNRIQELFTAALELEADARAAFLSKECWEDTALRKAVEDFLEEHENAKLDSFLEQPLINQDVLLDALTAELENPPLIGIYQLIRQLGEGGMGTVYLAERADGQFDMQVAIKIIRQDASNAELVKRFRAERQMLANLKNENIARLFDGGTTPDGRPYFVMDYVDGEPIDRYCDDKKLNIGERLKLFCQVCSAVSYAHAQGIVHRDLKPGNILVTKDGSPKLLDFGIAKLINPTEAVSSLAATQSFTPRYASPEQVQSQPVSFVSDIYSLGVILYELLTGHSPYPKSATTPKEQMQLIQEGNLLRPSEAISCFSTLQAEEIARARKESKPNKLRQLLQGDLDSILLKALSKQPDQRYASVDALVKDIECYLADKPVSARASDLLYRTGKFLKRNRAGLATAALVAGSISALWLGQGKFPFGPPPVRAIAVLPFKNIDPDPRNSYLSDGITEDISTKLGEVGSLDIISNEAMKRYKNSKKSPREIGAELGATALVTGSIQRDGERIHITSRLIEANTEKQIWAKSFDRLNEDIFVIQNIIATDIAQILKAKLTPEVISQITQKPTTSLDAYNYYRKGLEYYSFYRKSDNEQAIRLFQKALGKDPNFALAWSGLGDSYAQRVEKFGYSTKWLDYSIVSSQKALALNPNLAEGYKSLGLAYLYKGFFRKALQAEEKAISINPSFFAALNVYAFANGYRGDWDIALKALKKAQRLNLISAYGYISLAEAYIALNMDSEAEQQLLQAIQLQPDVYNGHKQLSHLYLIQGKYNDAYKQAQVCVSVAPNSADCNAAVGNLELQRGNLQNALNYYLKIPAVLRAEYYGASIGFIYKSLGKRKTSDLYLRNYIKYGERAFAYGSEDLDIAYRMATAYSVLGRKSEALTHLRHAFRLGWRAYREAQIDPLFSKLRHDSEFVYILREAEIAVKRMQETTTENR
ncbi:serine/threonine protein kinase [Gloeobacter kilaueensis JS1]|uniref:Serine/threonine protein kinase n=1 Tax=Gloeobacter kilaueensis (strain ATCC BAA-2537 / CCAP 1431/1 / ULC 316 / JS1) TaxID=1183438 RepID=U5QLF3_GLOK1|nr:serine/threonine protein kinase [Gloeobacter kilaueensis JS1]